MDSPHITFAGPSGTGALHHSNTTGNNQTPITYTCQAPVVDAPGGPLNKRQGSPFSRWLGAHRNVQKFASIFGIRPEGNLPRQAHHQASGIGQAPQLHLTLETLLSGERPLNTATNGELAALVQRLNTATDGDLTKLINLLPDATPAQLQQLAVSLPKPATDNVLKHDGFLLNLSARLLETEQPTLLDHVINAHSYHHEPHARLLCGLMARLMTQSPDSTLFLAALKTALDGLTKTLPPDGMPPGSAVRNQPIGQKNATLPYVIAFALSKANSSYAFSHMAFALLIDHAKNTQTLDILVNRTLAKLIKSDKTPPEMRDLALNVGMSTLDDIISVNLQSNRPADPGFALSQLANNLLAAWTRGPGMQDGPESASQDVTEAIEAWTMIMSNAECDRDTCLKKLQYPPRDLADLVWEAKKMLARLQAGGFNEPVNELPSFQLALDHFASETDPLQDPVAWNRYCDTLIHSLGNGYQMGELQRDASGNLVRDYLGFPLKKLTVENFNLLEQLGYLLRAGKPEVVEHCAPGKIGTLMQQVCANRYDPPLLSGDKPTIDAIPRELEQDLVYKGIMPALYEMKPDARNKVLLALLGGEKESMGGSVRHLHTSHTVRGVVMMAANLTANKQPESLTVLHALHAVAREASMLPTNLDAAGHLIAALSRDVKDQVVQSFRLLHDIFMRALVPEYDLMSLNAHVGLDDVVRFFAGKNPNFENVKRTLVDFLFQPQYSEQVKEHLHTLVPGNLDAVLAALQLFAPEASKKDLLKNLPLADLRPKNLSGAKLVPYLKALQRNANLTNNFAGSHAIRTLGDFRPAPGKGTLAAFEKAGLLPKNMHQALLVLKSYQKNDPRITAEGFLWSLDLNKLGTHAVTPAPTLHELGATSTVAVEKYKYDVSAERTLELEVLAKQKDSPHSKPVPKTLNVFTASGLDPATLIATSLAGSDANGEITAQDIARYLQKLDPGRYGDVSALHPVLHKELTGLPRNLERVMDVVKLIAPGTSVQDMWDHISSDMLGSTLLHGDALKQALSMTSGDPGSFRDLRNKLLATVDRKLKDDLGENHNAVPKKTMEAQGEQALLACFRDARLLPKNFEAAFSLISNYESRAGKIDLLFSLEWSKLNAGRPLTAQDLQSCLVTIDPEKYNNQDTLTALASGLEAQRQKGSGHRRPANLSKIVTDTGNP